MEKAGVRFSDFILYDIKMNNNKKLPNVINYKSLPSPKNRHDCKWRRESEMFSVSVSALGFKIKRTLFIYCNMTMNFYKVTNN